MSKSTHRMHLYPKHFKKLRNQQKEVEFRLYDEKRKKVKVGDGIAFINTETKEEFYAEVEAIVIGKISWLKRALNRTEDISYTEYLHIEDELTKIYGQETMKQQQIFAAFVLEVV